MQICACLVYTAFTASLLCQDQCLAEMTSYTPPPLASVPACWLFSHVTRNVTELSAAQQQWKGLALFSKHTLDPWGIGESMRKVDTGIYPR